MRALDGTSSQIAPEPAPDVDVSIVIPCLNEADTLETCIDKAERALRANGLAGEIIVADNGSTDGSQAIALRRGTRLLAVRVRGYGAAIDAGIIAARSEFVVMGDGDDSYDFGDVPRFVAKLREGYDLVQGCRFRQGGGRILPGAMPLLHRWIGNPLLSALVRRMFCAPVTDVYCGLRGFRKTHYQRLDQRCIGMEFATEMVIKSTLYGGRIAEIPVTLHPDGRKSHAPHLKTFRDGWRTLRFFLMYSPRWLFLFPGLALVFVGLVGYALALPGLTITGITFDAHTLLFASLAILCGYQSIQFAIFAKTFAINEGLMPVDARMDRFFALVNLERGLAVAGATLVVGMVLLGSAVVQWVGGGFGHLDYASTMRRVIPGVTLTALGFQTILSSFFVSILGMHKR